MGDLERACSDESATPLVISLRQLHDIVGEDESAKLLMSKI